MDADERPLRRLFPTGGGAIDTRRHKIITAGLASRKKALL
jgi:hypothetical protein